MLLRFAALTLLIAGPAEAGIVRAPVAWTAAPDFGKNEDAAAALSGAACVTGTDHCFAVNDEKKYAQFFDIDGSRLVPAEVIRLLPDEIDGVAMDEIDAEGVAYSASPGGDAFLYVIGSHGLSRSGELQPSRFSLLRFAVDPATGRPPFAFGDDEAAPEIARTTRLREAIEAAADLAPHAEQRLDRNGVTIEGIAVSGGEALFGLRSPCMAANAFVMRAPLDGLFGDTPPVVSTSKLALGDNVGTRDLATVEGGLLILAGRSDDARGDELFTCGEEPTPPAPVPSVWFWSGVDGDAAKPLGELPGVAAEASAEILLVLEEDEKSYRTLVLFDGVANGDPIEFSIEK